MASSAFEVLPALEADIGDISSIFTVSFADDHILGPANGNVAPELLRAADLEFINELWRTRETFNAKFFKVVDLTTRSVYPEIISCLLCNLSFFSFMFYVYVQTPSDFGYERPVQGSSTTYMNFISKKLWTWWGDPGNSSEFFLPVKPLHFPNGTTPLPLLSVKKQAWRRRRIPKAQTWSC